MKKTIGYCLFFLAVLAEALFGWGGGNPMSPGGSSEPLPKALAAYVNPMERNKTLTADEPTNRRQFGNKLVWPSFN